MLILKREIVSCINGCRMLDALVAVVMLNNVKGIYPFL